MRIIVGLGNPGKKYQDTRHNAGFIILDKLAKLKKLEWEDSKKFKALVAKDGDTIYMKPQTFMNLSGQSVQALMSFYQLLPKKLGLLKKKDSDLTDTLMVIHDDIDIELGKVKNGVNSGSAGHNGVQSIIQQLKTKNFNRIRIGIKTEMKDRMGAEKFVLSRFSQAELELIDSIGDNIIKNL